MSSDLHSDELKGLDDKKPDDGREGTDWWRDKLKHLGNNPDPLVYDKKPVKDRSTLHLFVHMFGYQRDDLPLDSLNVTYENKSFPEMNKDPIPIHTIFNPSDVGLSMYSLENDIMKGATKETACGFTCELLSNFGDFFKSGKDWPSAMDESVKWYLKERPPTSESMFVPDVLLHLRTFKTPFIPNTF